MKQFEVKDQKPSYLPEGSEWELVWADEFDGDRLDKTKWDFRLSMMGKRCPHWVADEGLAFRDGNLVFKLIEKDGVYCSSQIQTGYNFMDGSPEEFDALSNEDKASQDGTVQYFKWPIGEIKEPKFMKKYGFFECRCTMQKKEGWWNAFWLQSPIIGSTMNPELSGVEVDIMESFKRDNTVQSNNHWNGYGSQHQSSGAQHTTLKETEDDYHTFGLHWTKDFYRYYVDGELVREITAPLPVSQIEQFLLLSTEAVGYRSSTWNDWEHLKEAVGDEWAVDYVRVFNEVKR